MQSDRRREEAAGALRFRVDPFRSALTTAVEQLRADLETRMPDDPEAAAGGGAGLGDFALQRIDTARFAALLQRREPVDDSTLRRIERARDILTAAAARMESLWQVDLDAGGDAGSAVAGVLETLGRVFGAARTAEYSRQGRWDEVAHGSLLEGLSPSRWTAGEWDLAPPILVHVEEGDVRAAGLADLLDGPLQILLILGEGAPPAPLARLLSPGVFVQQTMDAGALSTFASRRGPAVAALVPEAAARFVHDPDAGTHLRERLAVEHMPTADAAATNGNPAFSRAREDLALLGSLAEAAAPPPPTVEPPVPPVGGAPPPSPPADDADRLAAWLLAQAGVGEAP